MGRSEGRGSAKVVKYTLAKKSKTVLVVEHVSSENAILERNGKPLINIAKVTVVIQLLVKSSDI